MSQNIGAYRNGTLAGQRTKACAYLWSKSNDDISIQTQRERLLHLSQREGCEITHWYVDESHAGPDSDRPGWSKLLSDAPTAGWVVIFCLHRGRFSGPNSVEDDTAKLTLRAAGKKFFSAIEGPLEWDDTVDDIIGKMIAYEGS